MQQIVNALFQSLMFLLNSCNTRHLFSPNVLFAQESMDDTFLLSNILPQDRDNNAGFWNRFEIYCREQLTDQFEEVRVISGPLFLPNVLEGGNKYVKYQVIPSSKLGHFKIVI